MPCRELATKAEFDATLAKAGDKVRRHPIPSVPPPHLRPVARLPALMRSGECDGS